MRRMAAFQSLMKETLCRGRYAANMKADAVIRCPDICRNVNVASTASRVKLYISAAYWQGINRSA
jgi:hypothetical protein